MVKSIGGDLVVEKEKVVEDHGKVGWARDGKGVVEERKGDQEKDNGHES